MLFGTAQKTIFEEDSRDKVERNEVNAEGMSIRLLIRNNHKQRAEMIVQLPTKNIEKSLEL